MQHWMMFTKPSVKLYKLEHFVIRVFNDLTASLCQFIMTLFFVPSSVQSAANDGRVVRSPRCI